MEKNNKNDDLLKCLLVQSKTSFRVMSTCTGRRW